MLSVVDSVVVVEVVLSVVVVVVVVVVVSGISPSAVPEPDNNV